MDHFKFKGGEFRNRYKLTGTLSLTSPLHIGDGESTKDEARLPMPDKGNKIPEYSTVITDVTGRAYIPGSTLKGKLRSWVTQIFMTLKMASNNDIVKENELREKWDGYKNLRDEKDKKKENFNKHAALEKAAKKLGDALLISEYLFGSHINEGKLECENAFMIYPEKTVADKPDEKKPALCGYDVNRGTMIMKGVAIDPVTGTAAENKLYNYEAVPAGARFAVTLTGQNLSVLEMGMLLFALEGFNSEIYPVTLGAMGGIGFGRISYQLEDIYCLDHSNLHAWLKNAVANGHAGYEGLDKMEDKDSEACLEVFRKSLLNRIEKEAVHDKTQ